MVEKARAVREGHFACGMLTPSCHLKMNDTIAALGSVLFCSCSADFASFCFLSLSFCLFSFMAGKAGRHSLANIDIKVTRPDNCR